MIVKTNYCSRCKATEIPLMVYIKSQQIGKIKYFHLCRPCNYRKQKIYYERHQGKRQIEINKRMIKKYPEKFKARQMVAKAIKTRQITKPVACNECGTLGRIEGHHADYSKPLFVLWLCVSCHSNYHRVD